jgi:multidrug efflux system membrane fusion protein
VLQLRCMNARTWGMGMWLAAGAVCLAGCPKARPAAEKPAPPEVTVSKPIAREVTDYFEFPGQTAAVGEVEVRARVTGYLMKVNFEDGQEVKKGDLLFEIDPRPYQAALDRAVGDLARLQALMEKAKADLVRSERLRPSGAVSQDEYEQHVAQLAIHKASIQSSQAAVRDAELNLEFTKINAPIDGRVSRTRITEGNLVQPGAGDSTVLTTVVTTDPIYVYFNIDEDALLKYEALAWGSGRDMRPARIKSLKIPVEIALGNEEGFPHAGVLDFLDNEVDQGTGTIRARGVFANPKLYLIPGLFVRVRIPFGQPHQALLVSERAIGTDQKQKFLWTVDKDNVVKYRQVKVGPLRDGLRVIESGLEAGDWVVVKGLQRVRAGVTVQPQPDETGVAASPAPAAAEVGKADRAGAGRATTN